MTLQIISIIILFACCVVMFVCNRKLKKKLKDMEQTRREACNGESLESIMAWRTKLLEKIKEVSDWEMQAKQSRSFYDIQPHDDGSVDVVRIIFLTRLYGKTPYPKKFATLIKRFNDEDASFNLREAQELVEMLNEK